MSRTHGFTVGAIEGVPPERLWEVAREARVGLSTVFAIAGGHTKVQSGDHHSPFGAAHQTLPVDRVRLAARRVHAAQRAH